MPSRIDNAKHWRDRADETLAIADQIADAEAKRILLGIAQGYAQLARMAEARKMRSKSGTPQHAATVPSHASKV